MDAKIVHIMEKEVPDFSVGGNSGVDLDSSIRQVREREYENNVACEPPPLPVKSSMEGVDQGLAPEPVAECLKHRSQDDIWKVDTNIEDDQDVQKLAAKSEVVELPKQPEVDHEMIPEMMVAKSVPIVETEVPDVSIGASLGADLNSGSRQIEDRQYGDHAAAYEQLSLPLKSCVHGWQYEPGSSVVEHLEHRTRVDLREIDTELEDVKEVLEQAVESEAVELPTDQVVNQELVSEKIDAKVVSIVEKEVPNMSVAGSLDLDSGHLMAEQLEHRTGDFHEVDSVMEDVKEVQEQGADTEAVEMPKEQKEDRKMDAKLVPTIEEVPDVSVEGSPDLDSGPGQACIKEYGTLPAYGKPPLPVNSFDKRVDHGLEHKQGSSVAEHPEHRTGDFHEVDSEMEDVKEMENQAAGTELPKEQDVDQELVSRQSDAKLVSILEKEVPDVSIRGSLDSDSDPRQAEDRNNENYTAYEQPASPINSINRGLDHGWEYEPDSSIAGHLEHGATGGIHEVNTDMEDVKKVQEQASILVVDESPKEHIYQELVCRKVDAKVPNMETEVLSVSNGGSSVVDLDSGLRQVGDRENEDNAAGHQPSLQVKSFVKGVHHELGYGSAEHLEHRATGDVLEFDRDMENVKEIQEQATSTEAAELLEEPVDQELVYKKMDAKITSFRETEAPNDSIGGSPAKDLDSGPGQVGEREYEHHAAYEHPSLPVKSFSEGIDNGLEYKVGFILDENLEHGAMVEAHEVDLHMDDVQEVIEQAANTEAIELAEEQEVDQALVCRKMNVKLALVEKTEVPDVCTGGSPGVYIDSSPSQIGDGEYGDQAACEQPRVDQGLEYEPGSLVAEHLEHSASDDVHEVDTNMDDIQEVEEQAASNEAVKSREEQGDQELIPHSAKSRSKEENKAKRASSKPGSLMKDHRVSYQLPPENEGEFAVFDLVWGKVKSHPWWPGQIFHPSDSSEKAMKYYRKDCYLVAYFGDRTFAWNEASVLKPFRNHFPQAERQNNSEAFQNAVSCALEEVFRRVELGLACSCLSEEAHDKIKYQLVENTGIREESSRREGVDRSTGVDSFLPDKLTEYVRTLALFPTSGADRLELSIAKAQLLAFNRLKGCDALPDFQYYEGLVEYDADTSLGDPRMSDENEHADSMAGVDVKKGFHKRKHNLKDIVYQRRKEKSMTELMSEYYLDGEFDSHEEDDINLTSHTVGAKRKASGFLTDESTAQKSVKTISFAKVLHASSNPQQSFKVGECIRRVASQLTGSSVIIKGCSEGSNNMHSGDDVEEVSDPPDDALTEDSPTPSKESSLDEILSQLHLSARDPMKGYSFLSDIISFFSEFRNLAVTAQRQKMRKGFSRKRKSSVPVVGSPETFEFDDRNDSYWTDMVVQNNAEAKPARRVRKRKDEQVVSGDPEKPLRPNRRKYSRKQYHHDNHESASETPIVDEKKLDLPTELMLNFGEMNSVLSEVILNKMFRRFGPLKESETEVDMQSSRAKVVFKKRSDAEVAYSSAAMFNIFGSTIVNYQLNYTPSASIISPLALTDAKKDAT